MDDLNRPLGGVGGFQGYDKTGPRFEFTYQLQQQMFRLGCYDPKAGLVDGKWGPNSSQSLKNLITFLEYQRLVDKNAVAGWTIDAFENSATLLSVLRSLPSNLCKIRGVRIGATSALDGLNTPPFEEPGSPKYTFTLALQQQLRRIGCEGSDIYVDGVWGPGSSKGLINFVSAMQTANFPGWSIDALKTEAQLMAALRRAPEGTCSGGVPRVSLAQCTKSEIGAQYLERIGAGAPSFRQATRLREPLAFVTENFNLLFPDPGPDSMIEAGTRDPKYGDPRETYEKFGKKGVNRVNALRVLQDALDNFDKLSFAYGLAIKRECDSCNRYNDWLYLRNIAQATDGYLVARPFSVSKSDGKPNDGRPNRVRVDTITEKMLAAASSSIRNYRSILANINWTDANGEVAPAPEVKKYGLAAEDYEAAKKTEMEIIVQILTDVPAPDQRPYLPDNRDMKSLASVYGCAGFTGSTTDK